MKGIRHFSFSLLAALALLVGLGPPKAQAQLTVAGKTVDLEKTGYVNGTGISPTDAVHYDHVRQELTLTDATINGGNSNAITNRVVDDLTIKLVGDNTIQNSATSGYSALNIREHNTIITGDGTLTLTSAYVTFNVNNAVLTIDGVNSVIATGNKRGFQGFGPTSELVIKNSTVRATGTEEGSIRDFATFTLQGG